MLSLTSNTGYWVPTTLDPALVTRPSARSFNLPKVKTCGRDLSGMTPDFRYLLQIIDFLKNRRLMTGLSAQEVARRAKVKRGTIDQAENDAVIPTTREFKAWAGALGLPWEVVWSEVMKTHLELIS